MRVFLHLIVMLAAATAWSQEPVRNPPPEPAGFQGWSGIESLRHTAGWTAQQPRFELTHPKTGEPVWQDNATARVCLWETQAAANGGKLPELVPQEIGDCTSQGAARACERMQRDGFKEICSEFIYGAARVDIAKGAFGPDDGCSGASTARAVRDIGVIPRDTPGVGPYSGRRAKEWGAKGPPAELKALAAKHRVKTVSLMKTPEDVRDAVCNRFPVTVASNFGTQNKSMRVQDGRIVARLDGRWSHQMVIDGYDGSVRGKEYWHVTNSWGPDAHPEPIDGSPPGGFWIERPALAFMLAPQDSWAYSEFDGFPAELDLSPLRPKRRANPIKVRPVGLAAPRGRTPALLPLKGSLT